MTVLGHVTLRGEPARGALVRIEEHIWQPGTVHGVGEVEADGRFEVVAEDMVSVEDCWGIMLDYTLTVSLDGYVLTHPLNASIMGAWSRGEAVADLRALPLELDESWVPPRDTGMR